MLIGILMDSLGNGTNERTYYEMPGELSVDRPSRSAFWAPVSTSDYGMARLYFTNHISGPGQRVGDDSMTTPTSDLYREAIRKTLMNRVGNARDASLVAGATLDLSQQMTASLAPVIGARGVDVLFRRSLHLASRTFPWLVMAGEPGDSVSLPSGLQARLADSAPDAAMEAILVLFVTFTELLSTLIGESLTERLLGRVLALNSPSSVQESES